VEATGFRPVLAINDQGLVLGVIADGSWAVGGDSLLIGSARERTRLRSLLPLLERPFREVEAAVAQRISGQPGPPWSELLTMALRWPTEYWADRALDWIEGGYADHELSGVLDEAGQMPTRSQRFRHRDLRERLSQAIRATQPTAGPPGTSPNKFGRRPTNHTACDRTPSGLARRTVIGFLRVPLPWRGDRPPGA